MEVLRTAILDFCRKERGKPYCPSKVVRQMFPEDWELFMPDVFEEMMKMYREGLIQVSQKGRLIDPAKIPEGPVRISGIIKPK